MYIFPLSDYNFIRERMLQNTFNNFVMSPITINFMKGARDVLLNIPL